MTAAARSPDGTPSETLELEVRDSERIDRLLARDLPLSRSRLRALLDEGRVTVDGRPVSRPSFVPPERSRVVVTLPPPEPADLPGDSMPLEVLHEDAALLVVDKPAGLVVHPAPGHRRGTLVNALIARGSLAGLPGDRPGIVHRLDKDTSGVIVVARTEAAHAALAEQFRTRSVRKLYDAVAWGHLSGETGTVERPIARSRRDRQRMAVDPARGRAALTRWRVLARYGVADHVELDLATGRTHQIRVHLASLGHPVVGDERYGGGAGAELRFTAAQRPAARRALAAIGRVALHARRLELHHPVTGEPIAFEAPVPADFRSLLEVLAAEPG